MFGPVITLLAGFALLETSAQCECGQRSSMSTINFPSFASITQDQRRYRSQFLCGTTIISSQVAVTSATCALEAEIFRNYLQTERYIALELEQQENQLPVGEFVVHPDYNRGSGADNIAIIKLKKPIDYEKTGVVPACLPTTVDFGTSVGTQADTPGYRLERRTQPIMYDFSNMTLEIVATERCKRLGNGNDGNICAVRTGENCQDQEGGPLLVDDETTGRTTVVGVVSQGWKCFESDRNDPWIAIPVARYLSWITEVTGEKFCNE